jgi:fatty-acyl-CoA synthase
VHDPQGRLTPAERADRLTLAGASLVGVRLKISEDGAILGRAAKTFAGYWHRPEATAEAYSEGWLNTGDGGDLVSGRLRITDRKKDLIVSGGENVSSLEVESCLFQHPGWPT